MEFWRCVRERFANTDDQDRPNYWGKTRTSNLFNKVSLTILASDFFQSLVETKKQINSVNDISPLVDDWLEDVNTQYFDKDWKFEGKGFKKDSPGIRKQWADIWVEYRKNPANLPDRRRFSTPKMD